MGKLDSNRGFGSDNPYSASGVRIYLNITGARQEKMCLSRRLVKNFVLSKKSLKVNHGHDCLRRKKI
jgi:hypothetical protein